MGVVGARISPDLGQRVREHCGSLGKTPSEWVRELVEKELSGKTPTPAIGDAIQSLARLLTDNTKLVATILAVSVGLHKTIIQLEMLRHPERARQLEALHREFRESLLQGIPKEQLTIEMGLRVSDLTSEIERIKGEKQIQ